jgi:hypothetical protein
MMATSTVNLFDPNGDVRAVPSDQAQAAMQAGGHPAVKMFDPQGAQRWVRQEQVQDAVQAGGRLAGPGDEAGQAPPPPSLRDYLHQYVQDTKQRIGSSPGEWVQNMGQRLKDADTGQARYFNRDFLTIAKLARSVDQGAGLYTDKPHPLDSAIAAMQRFNDAPLPDDPERRGAVGIGDDASQLLEYMAGEKVVKGAVGMLENYAPVYKALKSSPIAAKVLRTLVEQGITGGGQAALQGGDLGDVAKAGATAAAMGGLTELPGARVEARAAAAGRLAPEERTIRDVPFKLLKSELVNEHGRSLATPEQTHAAEIQHQPEFREQREAGFKQLQTNLAKQATENELNRANSLRAVDTGQPTITGSVETPSSVWQHNGPDGQAQTFEQSKAMLGDMRDNILNEDHTPDEEQQLIQQHDALADKIDAHESQPAWNYIAPNGQSLNPEQTRAALRELEQQWLGRDWSPGDNTKFQTAYNDMKGQLERYDSYPFDKPHFPPHDVPKVVDSIGNYGNAADYFNQSARQRLMKAGPEVSSTYRQLAAARDSLQKEITAAQGDPDKIDDAMGKLKGVSKQIEEMFAQPEVGTNISPTELAQGLREQRLAHGFQMLQNTMDKHFTYTEPTAADIKGARTFKGFGSLASDIERVKNQYGDVLNSAIGDKGLNHITEMGQYMNLPEGKDRIDNIMGATQAVLRRHYQGLRGATTGSAGAGAVGTAGILTAAHMIGHLTGVTGLALGALGTEAGVNLTKNRLATNPVFNRAIIDRLSSDPAFAHRFLFGAKSLPPRHAAPLLAASLLNFLKPTPDQTAVQKAVGLTPTEKE